VEPDRLYGAVAVIRDARGRPLWETRVPIRLLTMGNQKSVRLALRLEIRLDGSTATAVAPDSTVVLQRADTPYGKKYSDGATTLTALGEAAYLESQSGAYRDCKVSVASGTR